MTIRPRTLVALTLLLAWALPVAAAKLDKDDKEWLEHVRPLLLADEEKLYKDLDEKADRLAFRELFWARRDPDLGTPENEFKTKFEAAREQADAKFRVAGRNGSQTDCGRVFLLLGEPDEVEQQIGSVAVGLRVPEAWTYRDRPGQTFQGGEAIIALDDECQGFGELHAVLDQIAAAKVVQRQLVYRVADDGHLVTLEEQLPKASPARVLLNAPREDFPVTTDVVFLRVSEGVSGIVGLLRGEVADADVQTRDGRPVLDVVVTASAAGPDGEEVGWTEQPVRADVQPDGSFVASFGMAVPPGEYTLKAGVLVGEQGSVATESIEVPDFSRSETAADGSTLVLPSVASILFVRDIEDLPAGAEPDQEHPYASFRLGRTQLVPYFGRTLEQSDTVSFFYFIYNLQLDPATEKADSVVAFALLKDGRKPVAQAPESPIDTALAASSIGPVPLGAYPPGRYVVQLRVTDRLSKKTVVKNERFTIIEAPTEAPAAEEAPETP